MAAPLHRLQRIQLSFATNLEDDSHAVVELFTFVGHCTRQHFHHCGSNTPKVVTTNRLKFKGIVWTIL